MAPSAAVIRLGALGDVVIASSLVQALASAGYRVTLVTEERFMPLAAAMPGLHDVAAFDRRRHRGLSGLRKLGHSVGAVDLVVDLQHKVRTSILKRYIDARQRRALVLRDAVDGLRALLGRDRIIDDRHQIEIAFDVVRDLVPLAIPPEPQLVLDAPRRHQVALAPGAAHAAKRWPAERFGRLARRLENAGWPVVVIIGPDEEGLLREIEAAAKGRLASTLGGGVDRVLGVCAESQLVIANDTGPGHVAAALGTPVLAIFGPTSETRWRPRGPATIVSVKLECRPCTNHGVEVCPLQHHCCMQAIPVSRVRARALYMLRKRARPA